MSVRLSYAFEKGTSVTYTYDAGGSRASKTVNGSKSEYRYLNGKLVYEKRGGDDIFYLYDSYGSLSNIRWYKNGASSPTNIYVITNRQGDVLGLYDYAGRRKVSYEYDAWGNTVSVTDTSQDNWSTLNPFRYRGYYFDTETGLYYLLSRYYDPAVGRFLNADGYISTGTGITGLNMFAYCGNNPVTRADYTGMFWKEIGDFFSKAFATVIAYMGAYYGVSSSTTKTEYDYNEDFSIVPWLVSVKQGAKSSKTISKIGSSSKPVSFYASRNIDHPIRSSSVGVIHNYSDDFATKLTVGLDDISLSCSGTSGNTTNSFAIKLNVSELKLGLEYATAIPWDDSTKTVYTNVSINVFTILAAFAYATAGDTAVLPQPAYS